MFRKKYTINIDSPCIENWGDMNVTANGRHCAACEKEVVDFSNLSDADVIRILKKGKGQQLCGRFKTDQLNRLLLSNDEVRTYPFLKRLVTSLLLLSGFEISRLEAHPPHTPKIETVLHSNNNGTPADTTLPKSSVASDTISHTIRGIVVDDKGQSIPFASVILKQNGSIVTGCKTDLNGKFILVCPTNIDASDFTIVVSELTHSTVQMQVTEDMYNPTKSDNLKITLTSGTYGMLEINAIPVTRPGYPSTNPTGRPGTRIIDEGNTIFYDPLTY